MTLPRRIFWLGACAAGLVVASGRAEAHAQLRQAEPAVGASIRVAPDQVSLLFSEGVEPAFSSILVTDATGARVDRGDLHRDPAQTSRLITGLQKLSPGSYRVDWKVTSVDTHKTEGSFTFTLLAPALPAPAKP